jgi:hypothetical protein
VAASQIKGTERFAIKPYPIEMEERFELPDGSAMLLRPIRPEDEPRLQEGFARLSAESIRMRFFAPLKTLTHEMAARLTQIDYDREIALVLTTDQLPGEAEIFAVARLSCDPDNKQAEFALTVGDDFAGLRCRHPPHDETGRLCQGPRGGLDDRHHPERKQGDAEHPPEPGLRHRGGAGGTRRKGRTPRTVGSRTVGVTAGG